MAITKNEITREVRRRLSALPTRPGEPGYLLENVDAELLDCVQDLAVRGEFLQKTTTLTTVSGTAYCSLPADLLKIIAVRTADDGILTPIPWAEYSDEIAGGTSSGPPKKWAENGGGICFLPTPNAAYSVYLDHSYRHSTSLATIAFADAFREVIVEGVMARVWGGILSHLEVAPARAAEALARYERGIVLLLGQTRQPVRLCRYNDI